jgi:hypothetical protein
VSFDDPEVTRDAGISAKKRSDEPDQRKIATIISLEVGGLRVEKPGRLSIGNAIDKNPQRRLS